MVVVPDQERPAGLDHRLVQLLGKFLLNTVLFTQGDGWFRVGLTLIENGILRFHHNMFFC